MGYSHFVTEENQIRQLQMRRTVIRKPHDRSDATTILEDWMAALVWHWQKWFLLDKTAILSGVLVGCLGRSALCVVGNFLGQVACWREAV
jgi:hypothetical protein